MRLRRWHRDGKRRLIWCWHGNRDWRLNWRLDGRWHWWLRKAPVVPGRLRWHWSWCLYRHRCRCQSRLQRGCQRCLNRSASRAWGRGWRLYRHRCRCQSRLQQGWQRHLDRSTDGARRLSRRWDPGIFDLKAADEGIVYQCHELKCQRACRVCSYIEGDIVCYVLPTCKQGMLSTQSKHHACASGLAPVDSRCDVNHGMLATTRYLQLRFSCRSVHCWLQPKAILSAALRASMLLAYLQPHRC